MWKPETLVLSGGGMKGFFLAGAFSVLELWGYLEKVSTIACTSIGALVGGLYCLGFSSSEMMELSMSTDFEGLMKELRPSNFLTKGYFCDGQWLEDYISFCIEKKTKKRDISLKELYEKSGIRLMMNTVLRKGKGEMVILDYVNNPNISLITAIRMTSCIPGLMKPIIWEGVECYDGGGMDNYMISHFSPDNTLGIYLGRRNIDRIKDEGPKYLYKKGSRSLLSDLEVGYGVKEFMETVWDMFTIISLQLENMRVGNKKYKEIIIDPKGVNTFSFLMEDYKKHQMIHTGAREAFKFIMSENSFEK